MVALLEKILPVTLSSLSVDEDRVKKGEDEGHYQPEKGRKDALVPGQDKGINPVDQIVASRCQDDRPLQGSLCDVKVSGEKGENERGDVGESDGEG